MKKTLSFIFLMLWLGLTSASASAFQAAGALEPAVDPASAKPFRIPAITYQVAAAELTIDDVLQQQVQQWRLLDDEQPSFGYTSDIYWLKFELPERAADRVVNISYSLLDYVDVYFVDSDARIVHQRVGDQLLFDDRPVRHKDFVLPVPSQAAQTVYMRVETTSSMRVPITVWEHAEFLESQVPYSKAAGLYYGVVICMAVYNLFGFFVSRERSFLTYSVYTVFMGLLMSGLDGSGFRYLWSESLWLQDKAVPLFGSLVFILAALFTAQLLELKRHSHRLLRGLQALGLVFSLLFVLALFLPYAIVIKMLLGLAVPACLFLLGTGVYLWRRGHIYARVFTVAWTSFLIAVIANSLAYLGLIDGIFIQRYAIMIGSGVEILLLSWVLAIRYSEERKEKLIAQSDALERANEMQQAQEQLNEQLEEKVSERTFELEIAMRELQEANAELEQKSSEDALTGIYNRRYMNRQLEIEFRRAYRQQSSLALVMMDIDYFKPVNDTYGHMVGDQILRQLALLLNHHLRRVSDVLCRFGGEEFALILPNTDQAGAVTFARKLSQVVREHQFKTDAGPLTITLSMGVAVAEVGDYSIAEQLLAAADKALYDAKHAGRDEVRLAPSADKAVTS